jgi:outer membrane lipopolysaccharide assembly protein LptE/RlpB
MSQAMKKSPYSYIKKSGAVAWNVLENIVRVSLLIFLGLSVTACGYQLKGYNNASGNSFAIQLSSDAAKISNLQSAITQSGINITDNATIEIQQARCSSLTIDNDETAQTRTVEISCNIQSTANERQQIQERRRIIQEDTSNSVTKSRDRSIAEIDLFTDLLQSLL